MITLTITLPEELAAILQAAAAVQSSARQAQDPSCPWQSPDVPFGFQTVVGRMAERGLLDGGSLIVPTATSTQRDGFWCKARSQSYCKVEAPQKLRDMGIREVNAYPISVVDDRIDLILARLEVEENPNSHIATRMLRDTEFRINSKYA